MIYLIEALRNTIHWKEEEEATPPQESCCGFHRNTSGARKVTPAGVEKSELTSLLQRDKSGR